MAVPGTRIAVPGFFFGRLVLMALAVTLPLMVLHAYTVYQDFRAAQADAYSDVTLLAQGAARELEALLNRSEDLLTFISEREEPLEGESASCTRFLRKVPRLDPLYSHIGLVAPDGRLICATVEPLPSVSYAKTEWLRKSLRSDRVQFTAPEDSQLEPPLKVAVLARQLRNEHGTLLGVLAVAINLTKLSESLGAAGLRAGETIAVLNDQAVLMARFPQPAHWIGQLEPAQTVQQKPLSMSRAFVASGADGTERAYGTSRLSRFGIVVSAGTPTAMAFGAVRAKAITSASLAAGVLVLMLVLALYGANWLSRPLKDLRKAIRQRLEDGSSSFLPEDQPGEFKAVAVEFNRLSEARDAIERVLTVSEQRATRFAEFYLALSNANQAMCRRAEPQVVFEGICKTCVSARHARMAWIGKVVDGVMVPIAWGGRAKEYTEHSQKITLATSADQPPGPVATAVSQQAPCVVNNIHTDPLAIGWRDVAIRFDVQSMAVFPFRCKGDIAGVLALYSEDLNYFDTELVRLLSELAGDISFTLDNRENEAERHAAEGSARRHEKQLADIVETASDAIVSVNLAGEIEVFNDAAVNLFQVSRAAAMGKPLSSLLPDFADLEDLAATLSTLVKMAAVRGDGTAFDVEISVSRAGEGAGVLRTVVLRDATKARAAEMASQARFKAEAASQVKTQFIARMSHELRTPLNAVLGFSQLLQSTAQSRLTEQERNQLDLVFLAGAQLRALIDDVLDVSRIEAGALAVELWDISLTELLDGAVNISQVLAQQKGIEIQTPYRAKGLSMVLHTDPLRLRQALINLISNGIKYNQAGGVVSIDVVRKPGRIEMVVADSGMGMTGAQLETIFQPFNRQGREHSSIEGTGIGMSICRQLVELLGGALTIESEPGQGTLARISLPYVESEESVAVSGMGVPDHGKQSTMLALEQDLSVSGTLLYIEDEPVNALLVQQLLSRWPNVKLTISDDGADGIAQAHQLKPDLVILDMNLPDMTGLELLSVLKAEPATRDLRVVALSASVMESDIHAALNAGALDYWAKPIEFVTFLNGLKALLVPEVVQEAD